VGAGAGVLGSVGLVGCTPARTRTVTDPDEAALTAARQTELTLLANYAVADPAYQVHLSHLRALGGNASSPAPTSTGATSPREAAAALAASIPSLQAAAISAVRGRNAAVLASVAAAHAAAGRA